MDKCFRCCSSEVYLLHSYDKCSQCGLCHESKSISSCLNDIREDELASVKFINNCNFIMIGDKVWGIKFKDRDFNKDFNATLVKVDNKLLIVNQLDRCVWDITNVPYTPATIIVKS